MLQDIFIPISKKQMLNQAFGSIIFLLLGLFVFFQFENFEFYFISKFNNPQIIRIVGLACIFLSVVLLFTVRPQIFRKKLIGITLNQTGLHENSGIFPIGFINWKDISHLQEVKYKDGFNLAYSSVIYLVMKDVNKFIADGGLLRRIYLKSRWGGPSPIYIFNAYDKDFDEIKILINEFFENYKK